jgi:hypothetical protein
LQSPSVFATSILSLSFNQVVNKSALVFEGTVIDQEVSSNPFGQQIMTYVTFNVTDVIKGEYSQSTIRLGFLGGKLENRGLFISGLNVPALGEHGIYFVAPGHRIHPLVGWSQGHFLVKNKESGVQVQTSRGTTVSKVVKKLVSSQMISKGIADGIITNSTTEQALTLQEFKTSIKTISENVQ